MIDKMECNNCKIINFTDEIYLIEEIEKWYCYQCVLNWDYDNMTAQIFQNGFWEAHENKNISMKENYINIPEIYIKENYKTYFDLHLDNIND